MICPDCGAASRVLQTRETVRRRQCENGHRFSTEEVLHKAAPDRIKSYQIHMIRVCHRMGKRPDAIAQQIGLPVEAVLWILARHE